MESMKLRWRCKNCGNVNHVKNSKCLNCDTECHEKLDLGNVFQWEYTCKNGVNVCLSSYYIGVFRFDMVRFSDHTDIRCMIKPYVEGKMNNRYISCDAVTTDASDDEGIVGAINLWLREFNKKTNLQIE